MKYNGLGRSGIKVSEICLGSMMFGGRTNEAASSRIIGSAFDNGVNFIDTANSYLGGESERIVGKFIRRRRADWILATKVGNPVGIGVNDRGLGRKHLISAVDASLMRLKTDYIDLLYFHIDDEETPLDESLAVISEMITAGKLRYWGVSNFRGWRIALAVGIAEAIGAPVPTVCQPYYNAMNRMPEQEVLPACEYFGLGVVPYSPLARGVLTGKYGTSLKARGKGTRASVDDQRLLETEWRKESLEMAQIIKVHAEARGITAGAFALSWVLNNSIVSSVLAGPRTLGQWRAYLSALTYQFTAEDENLIKSLVPAGHPSTPGYSDPKYPLSGRRPRSEG